MKIIESNGKGYHVITEFIDMSSEFIDNMKSHYESHYGDFLLLKAKNKNEYLVCREIIDVDLSEEE